MSENGKRAQRDPEKMKPPHGMSLAVHDMRDTDERRAILQEIQGLETRAMKAGMVITSRGLNRAKNAWGWELSGDLAAALMALQGDDIP